MSYLDVTNIKLTNNILHVQATIKNAETRKIVNKTQKVSIKLDNNIVIKEVSITNGAINLNTKVNVKMENIQSK